MASNDRQAEEIRIRRILEINSYELTILEYHLLQNGYVPDSSDEQAARNAVFKFHDDFMSSRYTLLGLRSLFAVNGDAFNLNSKAIVKEAESVKYDAVRDLIHMLAVRKAQTSATQQQQGTRESDASIKEEGA